MKKDISSEIKKNEAEKAIKDTADLLYRAGGNKDVIEGMTEEISSLSKILSAITYTDESDDVWRSQLGLPAMPDEFGISRTGYFFQFLNSQFAITLIDCPHILV